MLSFLRYTRKSFAKSLPRGFIYQHAIRDKLSMVITYDLFYSETLSYYL